MLLRSVRATNCIHGGSTTKVSNAAIFVWPRPRAFPVPDRVGFRRARAQDTGAEATPRLAPLARLRLPARLSPPRGDRARPRGARLGGERAAVSVLRPRLAGFLSAPLERRRLRPLLYADADRTDLELRAVASDRRVGRNSAAYSADWDLC